VYRAIGQVKSKKWVGCTLLFTFVFVLLCFLPGAVWLLELVRLLALHCLLLLRLVGGCYLIALLFGGVGWLVVLVKV
jgi:hypothetical protein